MLPRMTAVHYTRPLLTHWCRQFELPVPLVEAMIQVESGGNTYAHRIEPGYRYLWDVRRNQAFRLSAAEARAKLPPKTFPAPRGLGLTAESEFIAQQTSWGLMQLMGANARSLGFTGPLPELTEASKGLEFGCRFLRQYADRYLRRSGWAGVTDAYNDGNAAIEYEHDYPHKLAAVSAEAASILELPHV